MRTWPKLPMNTAPSHSAALEVDWGPYYDAIPDCPSTLARLALPLVSRLGRGVDLGSGKMNDTRLMIRAGFRQVDSVDLSDASAAYARDLSLEAGTSFRFQKKGFDEFDFGFASIDWANSNFALPYDENFRDVVRRIARGLRHGGVFSATFLGPRDEPYRMHSGFSTIELDGLRSLLSRFSFTEITEHDPFSPFFDGHMKQWHYFRAICVK